MKALLISSEVTKFGGSLWFVNIDSKHRLCVQFSYTSAGVVNAPNTAIKLEIVVNIGWFESQCTFHQLTAWSLESLLLSDSLLNHPFANLWKKSNVHFWWKMLNRIKSISRDIQRFMKRSQQMNCSKRCVEFDGVGCFPPPDRDR